MDQITRIIQMMSQFTIPRNDTTTMIEEKDFLRGVHLMIEDILRDDRIAEGPAAYEEGMVATTTRDIIEDNIVFSDTRHILKGHLPLIGMVCITMIIEVGAMAMTMKCPLRCIQCDGALRLMICLIMNAVIEEGIEEHTGMFWEACHNH